MNRFLLIILSCASLVTLSSCSYTPVNTSGKFDLNENQSISIQSDMFDEPSSIISFENNKRSQKKLANIPYSNYLFASNWNTNSIYIAAARSNGLLQVNKDQSWQVLDVYNTDNNFGGYTAVSSLPQGGAILSKNKVGNNIPDMWYPDLIVRIDKQGKPLWKTTVDCFVDSIDTTDSLALVSGTSKQASYFILDLETGHIVSHLEKDTNLKWFHACHFVSDKIVCITQMSDLSYRLLHFTSDNLIIFQSDSFQDGINQAKLYNNTFVSLSNNNPSLLLFHDLYWNKTGQIQLTTDSSVLCHSLTLFKNYALVGCQTRESGQYTEFLYRVNLDTHQLVDELKHRVNQEYAKDMGITISSDWFFRESNMQ